jgi:hypothetical protein
MTGPDHREARATEKIKNWQEKLAIPIAPPGSMQIAALTVFFVPLSP